MRWVRTHTSICIGGLNIGVDTRRFRGAATHFYFTGSLFGGDNPHTCGIPSCVCFCLPYRETINNSCSVMTTPLPKMAFDGYPVSITLRQTYTYIAHCYRFENTVLQLPLCIYKIYLYTLYMCVHMHVCMYPCSIHTH